MKPFTKHLGISKTPEASGGSFTNSLFKFLVEVILIGVAVFLGLFANQWREAKQHQALATSTLSYFHEEALVNQKALAAGRQYHQTLANELEAFLKSGVQKTAQTFDVKVHFRGTRPVIFEHTAWDLALATQSLSFFKPQFAYALSRVYTRQQAFQTLEDSFLQAIYNPSTFVNQDATGLATALEVYMNDVNVQEPAILKLYDELLPEIEKAQKP